MSCPPEQVDLNDRLDVLLLRYFQLLSDCHKLRTEVHTHMADGTPFVFP